MIKIDQYHPIYDNYEKTAILKVLNSNSWLSEFHKTEEFENELKAFTRANHVSCVNNGTIAISLALLANGITSSDTVLIPNITMIATATATEFIGCKVEFCDVDSKGCLDSEKAIEMLESNKNIRAVIYVTLNGRIDTIGVKNLLNYCDENKIVFIKDDAQSLGALSKDCVSLQSSVYGDTHTISFSPHKLVSCGQGGAIITNKREIYEKVERLKDFGRSSGGGDTHDYFGINSKFTEIQAAIGSEQLKKAINRIKDKRYIYNKYYEKLNKFMIKEHEFYVPWFMDIYVENREELIEYLKGKGIQTRKTYPKLTSQSIYYSEKEFPNADNMSKKGLWLPSSFDLKDNEIDYISNSILEFYEGK